MIHYHAAWIVPVCDPPFRNGWIAVDRDRIAAVSKQAPPGGSRTVDLGQVAVIPGLVNAHTHLELSHMRGEVPRAADFITWIRGVIVGRRNRHRNRQRGYDRKQKHEASLHVVPL